MRWVNFEPLSFGRKARKRILVKYTCNRDCTHYGDIIFQGGDRIVKTWECPYCNGEMAMTWSG